MMGARRGMRGGQASLGLCGGDEGGEMVGMRGHHIFLLRHIMTAEKRVMAVAVVMAMA